MLRKIGYTLLCAGALFSSMDALAMNHVMAPGVSLDYELAPNDPQIFENSMFWSIKAVCTIHLNNQDTTVPLLVKILRKSGKVNDKPYNEGETTLLTLQNNQKFTIYADSGAEVELTNQGPHSFRSSCSM